MIASFFIFMISHNSNPAHSPAQKRMHKGPPTHKVPIFNTSFIKKKIASTISTTGDDHPKLKIYALGGLEEVGRNMTVFECGEDIVLIDMGLQFPEEDMPGIDYIIPNISCLQGKEKNIRGIIITHGHYDHIGAIPHLLGRLGNPIIYTAPMTAGVIRKRQEDFRDSPPPRVILVNDNTKVPLGRHFIFEPFHCNHNIFDAFGVALTTPYGVVLDTGDFKFDYSPVNEEPADLNRIAMFGTRNVLALLSDSTNAESPGYQISEKVVGDELEKIVAHAPGRVIMGTFSSLLTRAQQILSIAEKYDRKVLIEGRSMKNNVQLAHELGYLKFKTGTIIEDTEFRKYPDNKLIVVCTGAQGEKNAVLMRIANNEHRFIQLKVNDTVVFSSSVIPGNERTVQSLKDVIVRHGAKVIHYQMMDVHAGGHAKQEDLKLMMRLTRPRYFIPVHGNRFLLQAHADLAAGVGIPKERIFVADNGQIMEFSAHGGTLTDQYVPTDYVMIDGLGDGDTSQIVLRDRRQLSEEGMFVIIATIEKKTGHLVGNPDIISRGFVYLKENKELIEKTRMRAKKLLKDTDPKAPAFEDYIKNKIRNDIGQFLYSQTKKRPMVLPVIIEV
ncbi:MAG: RNA-metabolising metallo-beta-lactamase [Candidatus Magasanikbacteria bacterium GW2011_GWC2_40_17]|uniref:Ribonuclease J n=1 Tax=Candidatus Magasanikbacteria bacterium GW2011_GWA2_42_32 TaxID=1619039 RepID=A0A0G1A8A7_9BACT|nr:MAG: RNA-metabolising metallo-beta-lactamase [Candidatus Magasanikbacteria bacterium GW2011_GWC2_40_17]KKS57287.1 MAG: RNA-metabolising metallo-beta-lactamase [Candidatus Magasanikbacteria bacterium GW2011_GWA2_42_32]